MADTDVNSIGSILRSERLRRGKALDVVAAETKISRAILEAIESDRFDSLPGGAYRRGFVRQYARALGLDEEEAVTTFQREHLEIPVALPAVPPARPMRHLWGMVSPLLAALAIVGFYKVAETEHPVRKHSALDQAPRPVTQPPLQTSPEPAKTTVPETKVPESAAGAPVHAVFTTMTEPVWVSVKCDGKPTFTGTLSEAESKIFEASAAVTVLIGNAGGLRITLNGQPLGPIGGHGEIQFLELTSKGTHRLPRSQSLPAPSDSGPAT
jgi:cytoskeleton protein RodZ